ncbi:MAG: VanZ family protein [Acidobacteriia bacterium]|nr:VanZ family protein [Terriglobia bacterium]
MHAPRSFPVLLTLVLSAAYIYIGTRAENPAPFRDVNDKLLHVGAYALLGFSAGSGAYVLGLAPAPVIGWGFAVGHGALLEVVQHFVPPRSAEVGDVLADAFGAALGAAALFGGRLRR